MKLWTLQLAIIAALLLFGWGVTRVPAAIRPGTAAHCLHPADDMARRACADISGG